MKLIKEYKESVANRVLNFLFTSNFEFKFNESIFSKIFVYENKIFALASIILSIFFYWYEGIILPILSVPIFEFISPILLLLSFYLVPKKSLFFGKFHIWYLLFLLMSLFSGLLALANGLDVRMIAFGWFFFVQLFLAVLISQSLNYKNLISKLLIALAIPNMLYGLYQIVINPNAGWSFSYLETMGVRASGLFGGPNVFALTCIIAFFASIYLFLEEKNKLYLTASLLFIFGVAFSFSRAGWLALAVALVYFVFRKKPSFLKFAPLVFLALLVGRVRERIFVIFSEGYRFDSSIDGRIWAFNNATYLTSKKPLFGYGPGSYGGRLAWSLNSPVYLENMQNGYVALHTTDNQYTEILVQTGIIGFILFVGSIVSLLAKLIRGKGTFAVIATALLMAWIVAGLFSNVFEFNAVTIPAALIWGVALGDNSKL